MFCHRLPFYHLSIERADVVPEFGTIEAQSIPTSPTIGALLRVHADKVSYFEDEDCFWNLYRVWQTDWQKAQKTQKESGV